MDTSPEYVKMCQKAEEIQRLRYIDISFEDGDYLVAKEPYEQVEGDDWPVADIEVGAVNIWHNSWRMDDKGIHPSNKAIWLPRQDQLQEMIHDYKFTKRQFSGSHGLIGDFAYWVEEKSNLPCASMEQLWLAFVMKEKYGKIWDGKNWIKEG